VNRYLILFLISLLIISCKKDDTGVQFSMPDKTQTGRNTFGCLLNNAVWINYGQVCFLFAGGCRENLRGRFYENDGDILVDADRVLYKDNSWNTSENIGINLSTGFRGTREYNTLNHDSIIVGYTFSEKLKSPQSYLLSQTHPDFSVNITRIDTVQNILSGGFSGVLFRRISDTSFAVSQTDSIIIKDGRFDIKY